MLASPYLTLLNPALALVFAAAFFVLWRYLPGRAYLAQLSLSQLGLAAGFLLQYYTLPFGASLTRLLSNAIFLVAVILIAPAVAQRYDRRAPLLLLSAIAVAALALMTWFIFLKPDIFGRIYSINFAIGLMLFVISEDIRAAPDKRPIDRCLHAILLLNAVLLFVRTVVTVHWGGGIGNGANLYASVYWIVFTFSHAIISLVTMLTVLAAIALDAMNDLKAKGDTDSLSGLLNRRGFEDAATRVLEASLRRPLPTTLIIADIDHFKSVNDSFGHYTGDRVISLFSGVMREVMDGHPIGRIGGEEFAVIARGVDLPTARMLAEGARVAFPLAPAPSRSLASRRRLTASFGVAEWRPGETYEELLRRADAALYRAKKAGRDCVKIAPEGIGQFAKDGRGRH